MSSNSQLIRLHQSSSAHGHSDDLRLTIVPETQNNAASFPDNLAIRSCNSFVASSSCPHDDTRQF